jgi:hemerythrin
MYEITKIEVIQGVYWIEIPKANVKLLCGTPADVVKHLMKRGLIIINEVDGVTFESGPNAILLSDVMIQNSNFSNLAEFPVLQMLYRQGMIIPNHPNNSGQKPILVGSREQVDIQMEYIYRGNYGLSSIDELQEAGLTRSEAKALMDIKLKFAFGHIRTTDELLNKCYVEDQPVLIKKNVWIKRIAFNTFEIRYGEETVQVDLNLKGNYDSPYTLGHHNFKRDYFAIIHSGQGDGWDPTRLSMSSVLIYQGKIYLIDVGPNVLESLRALGIGINEIEGIFHTHSHDDHFAGLPALMQSDRKLKYYTTQLVRTSVAKKFSSLMNFEEEDFSDYFTVVDLQEGVYNDIDGLEVKPIFSPHPVENAAFYFRTLSEDGYKSYAHLADLTSFKVLESMEKEHDDAIGISAATIKSVKNDYLEPATLKKIDAGGGMIHGVTEDFLEDTSESIVIAHTSQEKLTSEQKRIGAMKPFGVVDVLISGHQDLRVDLARNYLYEYFPDASRHEISLLLNSEIVTLNPGETLIGLRAKPKYIYLILSGSIEIIRSEFNQNILLSSGAFVGEDIGFKDGISREIFIANTYAQALKIPTFLYLNFIKKSGLYDNVVRLQTRREFLQSTWLFGDLISYNVKNKIAKHMHKQTFKKGTIISHFTNKDFYILQHGRASRFLNDQEFEVIETGDFFGEEIALFNAPGLFHIRMLEDSTWYKIDSTILKDIPMVHWKLFETFEKRKNYVLRARGESHELLRWNDSFAIGISQLDEQHKKVINSMYILAEAVHMGEKNVIDINATFLVDYFLHQFHAEEELLEKHGYEDLMFHQQKHEKFSRQLLKSQDDIENGTCQCSELISLIEHWLEHHVIVEDRKYVDFLHEKGIF